MAYRSGRHDLGQGVHAWLQADGGWGRSNAGLIVGDDASVLVDTLFDLPLTRRMLDGFAPLTRPAPIALVVNTHGNGDHWFGNAALPHTPIIASAAAAREMREVGPAQIRDLLRDDGAAGVYTREIFEPFDFADLEPVYPTRTFTRRMDLEIGGVEIRLREVGPAHTAGDTVVHMPAAGVVFAGDIVFAGSTPVVWHGPVANWLAALDLLLDLDADTIVPGHGPVITKAAVREMGDYLRFVVAQAAARYIAGMPADDAARDIDLGRFASLGEPERLAANVHAVYRELGATDVPLDGPAMFACMAGLRSTTLTTRSEAGTGR